MLGVAESCRYPAVGSRSMRWQVLLRPGTVWASTVDPADQMALDPGVPADLDRHPEVLVVGVG